MAIRDLTVKERILLHLFDFNRFFDEYEAPPEVTQRGIARAVGIRPQHVTQYVKPLVAEEVVEEATRHVHGRPRRVKVYFLTAKGRQDAVSLRGSILQEGVPFRRRGGEVEEMPLSRIYQEERRGARLVELVTEAAASGHIIEVVGIGKSGTVDFSQDAPPVDHFYGRDTEITTVLEALDRVPVVVVTGIAGIGKTTLGSELCNVLREKRSLLWTRVRRWQTGTDIAYHLGSFLTAIGRPRLLGYLSTSAPKNLDQVAQVLAQELPGARALVVLDDVHTASEDVGALLSILHDVLGRTKGWSALLLSRTTPAFYSRRDVEIEGSIVEVPLRGLDAKSGRAILVDAGVSEELIAPLSDLAGGSPLFLKLLAQSAAERGVDEGWDTLETYIAEEIEPALRPAERSCLLAASFYEFPIPAEALMLEQGIGKGTLVNLRQKGFLDRTGARRYVLHDSLRTYFQGGLSAERRHLLGAKVVDWLQGESERLADSGKPLEAIRAIENALGVEITAGLRWELLGHLGRLRATVGDMRGAIEAINPILKEAEDPEVQSNARRRLSMYYSILFQREKALTLLEEGLRLLPPAPSPARGALLVWKAYFRYYEGGFTTAWDLLDEVLPWRAQFPSAHRLWFRAFRLRGWLYIHDPARSNLDLARSDLEASLKEVEAPGMRPMAHALYGDLGNVALERGRVEDALGFYAQAIAVSEGAWIPGGLQSHLLARGHCLSECVGDQTAAEEDYARAAQLVKDLGWRHHSVGILREFARLYWRSGRLGEAKDTMAYFLEVSKEFLDFTTESKKQLLGRIGDLAVMVRYCASLQDQDRAGAYLEELRDLAKEADSKMASFFEAWGEGIFRAQWGSLDDARPFYERALSQVAEARRWENLLLWHPKGIVGSDFLLDYGRCLASSDDLEGARDVFLRVIGESERLSRGPLLEAAKQELEAIDQRS